MDCAPLRHTGKVLAALLVAGMVLGGCAADQVEFEGKIFDMVGMNDIGKTKKDRQMETRAPLVMPPSQQLPKPGPREQIATPTSWPVDSDERRKKEMADQKDAMERYYREGDFTDKAGIEEFEHITGRWDRRPGLLSKKANEVIEEEKVDVPSSGDSGTGQSASSGQ